MRIFIGMVFGCLLTIAAVYVHDSAATSTVVTGQAETTNTNMIVNWDVAARKWGDFKETVHMAWLKLQAVNASSSTRSG